MASAGTITVDFAVEIDKANAGIREVVGQLQGFGKQLEALNRQAERQTKSIEDHFASLGKRALQAFSIAAITSFTKQAFAAADATATAAERAGIAVETFSRLQFAAGQTDVEMAALTTGIQRFQVTLSKADDEGKQAIATLSRFGLEAETLRNLSIEDQLAEVAEAFKQIGDPADRTRLAVELFGKSAGPQLVPLLSQGKAGIQQLTAEADRLGITLTSSTAAGIDQADRAIKQLTGTLSAYAAKFVAGLSVVILGPPEEVLRIDNEIERLQERVRQITQGVGGRDPASVLGTDNPLVKELQAANVEIERLMQRARELLFPAPAPTQSPFSQISADIQAIDLAPIQALKIEVDELGLAYQRLATATLDAQRARVSEELEASTVGVVEAQKQIEQQITNEVQIQLQTRSDLESQYRQQRFEQDQAYAIARENLERATLGNVIGALQSFAGQSESVAIALVAIQKAQALAQAFQLGQVAIMQAAASAPPPYNAPAIAWAKLLTGISIAAILASGYGQVRQIRSSGGAPIGSPVNPVNTTQTQNQNVGATAQSSVQVIIANNVGFDQRVMDEIIAGIREAADDRDVIIFGPESRQAREIVGG